MAVVIRVEKVSKQYRLGTISRRMLYRDVQSGFARLMGRPDPHEKIVEGAANGSVPGENPDYLWALRDVCFDVHQGDVIGIIGRNGSGKSTLLKILSRITAPTEGRVFLKGRVACLLEVGTGFHPELTGRDNIYLNGSILGMTRSEITRKFDEIVDFSGVEKFIDTPVKRYSSGMTVRLAFAVAANLEPEILIIDEVLAVGDVEFQKKCLGKMNTVAREGRTILFVSHQSAAVENLCKRGIVLKNGSVQFDGTQTGAIAHYVNETTGHRGCLRDRRDRKGNGQVRVTEIEFRDRSGRTITTARSGDDIDVCLHFESQAPTARPDLSVGISIKTYLDAPVFLQNNTLAGERFAEFLPESGTFICRLGRLPLPSASFRIGFYILSRSHKGEYLDAMENAVELHVQGGDFFGNGLSPGITDGVALVEAGWRLEATEPPAEMAADRQHAPTSPQAT